MNFSMCVPSTIKLNSFLERMLKAWKPFVFTKMRNVFCCKSDYLQKDNWAALSFMTAVLCLEMFRPGLLGSLGGRRYKQYAPL